MTKGYQLHVAGFTRVLITRVFDVSIYSYINGSVSTIEDKLH